MNIIKWKSLLAILLLSSFMWTSCSKDENPVQEEEVEIGTLTEVELNNLIFLREEEKLARDVYQYLYDAYGHTVFKNIKASEQKHMNYVLEVMVKYDVDDPAQEGYGVFSTNELQGLYDQLTVRGDKSLLDALMVGATIEDLDINDLNDALKNTENEDLVALFTKLRCGSHNHMRGFYKQIVNVGGSYEPQYIDESMFIEIINAEQGHCD